MSIDFEQLTGDVEQVRRSGFREADPGSMPVLALVVSAWDQGRPFAELVQGCFDAALSLDTDHPSLLTARELFCLDKSTIGLTPREARRRSVQRIRGATTQLNIDAFRKTEQPAAVRFVAECLLRLVHDGRPPVSPGGEPAAIGANADDLEVITNVVTGSKVGVVVQGRDLADVRIDIGNDFCV